MVHMWIAANILENRGRTRGLRGNVSWLRRKFSLDDGQLTTGLSLAVGWVWGMEMRQCLSLEEVSRRQRGPFGGVETANSMLGFPGDEWGSSDLQPDRWSLSASPTWPSSTATSSGRRPSSAGIFTAKRRSDMPYWPRTSARVHAERQEKGMTRRRSSQKCIWKPAGQTTI